jgi:hypothetical protein
MKPCLLSAAAALGVLFFSSPASATLISPGNTVPVAVEALNPGYVVVAHTGPETVTQNGITATGQEWVVVDPSPPAGADPGFGAGTTLSFVYQITATTEVLSAVTGGSFLGFTADVGQEQFSAGLPGAAVGVTDFSTAFESGGGNIRGSFAGLGLPSGSTPSWLFIVNTHAPGFTPSTFGVLDNATVTLPGYAPSTTPNISVPEPTSAILGIGCILSFAGAAGLRRRRQSAVSE